MCQTCGGAGIVEASEGRKVWEDCPECGGKPRQTTVDFDESGLKDVILSRYVVDQVQ